MTDKDNIIQLPKDRVLVGADGKALKPVNKTRPPDELDIKEQDLMELFNVPYVNVRLIQGPDLLCIGLLVTDGDPHDPDTKGKVFNITFDNDEQFQAGVLTLKALGKVTHAALGSTEDDTPPPKAS